MPHDPIADRPSPDARSAAPEPPRPGERRDRGLRTARRLTGGLVAGSAALVLGLSVLTAGSGAGSAGTAAAVTTTTQTTPGGGGSSTDGTSTAVDGSPTATTSTDSTATTSTDSTDADSTDSTAPTDPGASAPVTSGAS
ncbi:unannotated protein [freshwater metagenome]|uniref:Unannotated protein n=1 Tax=freshwater metagenome TaxID=449393 RepID=A0A6J7J8M4_9ZZZZ|nr:hypothetical protein [Actinomycetota bacterium]